MRANVEAMSLNQHALHRHGTITAQRGAEKGLISELGHSRRSSRVPSFRSTPISRHSYRALGCLKCAAISGRGCARVVLFFLGTLFARPVLDDLNDT